MTIKVLVELKVPMGATMETIVDLGLINMTGFILDINYEPVPVSPPEDLIERIEALREEIVVVRGQIESEKVDELKSMPNVINVSPEGRIEHFDS